MMRRTSILLGLAACALALPGYAVAGDQTADVALVARYLDMLRSGKDANALLSDAPMLIDSKTQQPRPLAQFVTYANACQIKEIRAIPVSSRSRMPIGVTWGCGPHATQERSASFWFEGDRISKISWGEPLVIQIAPMPTPNGQN
ncbi:hypothetical protein OF829_11285 [Sphingomonas sp. LB-2]|uniref:hypothetical protein n=1 Tax=Sphingomonas caeni TaxID=2984949 RepID=UPI00223122A0|nr:hypothetical protein [Sphingomonas caeni]MCW3847823.1 hypothetical protein [Sphingomonas caeni]